MSSAVFVQVKGFGSALVSAMKARIAVSSSSVLVKAPRSRRRRLSSANQHSTRLSQDAEVGVKCRRQRGRLASQSWIEPRLVGLQVVEHEVHVEAGGQRRLDLIQEGAELHRAVAPLAGADHRARPHVERGEQVERAVPLVVVGAPLGLARAHGERRRRALGRLDLLGWMAPSRHRGAKMAAVEGHQRGAIRHGGYDDRPRSGQDGLFAKGKFCLIRRGQLVLPQRRARSGSDRALPDAGALRSERISSSRSGP